MMQPKDILAISETKSREEAYFSKTAKLTTLQKQASRFIKNRKSSAERLSESNSSQSRIKNSVSTANLKKPHKVQTTVHRAKIDL